MNVVVDDAEEISVKKKEKKSIGECHGLFLLYMFVIVIIHFLIL